MEKVDLFKEGLESWVGYFILESMSMVKRDENNPMFAKGYDPENMSASLIINGIELPVVETFKLLGTMFSEEVEKRAIEIVTEKTDAMFIDSLRNISRLTIELEEELQAKIYNMMTT
ncbi:hypothetical protein [Paenibacillus odorifer]|uniref:hypothetical protein n=1 Tax=Paenibacillus odorifer TaxID=189426 RepID=UPI00096DFE2B|nr:hypothetical protein [Paenibacillus odorifer]OMD67598.1 hypothetical protein BSK50_29965 [Paenibacillus odorifer]